MEIQRCYIVTDGEQTAAVSKHYRARYRQLQELRDEMRELGIEVTEFDFKEVASDSEVEENY